MGWFNSKDKKRSNIDNIIHQRNRQQGKSTKEFKRKSELKKIEEEKRL